jgi:hypothetical protein
MLLHRLCCGSKCCSMLAALCWKSSGNCKDFKFWCREEQEGTMANRYQTHILTKSYRGIQVCSFCTTGKVGVCRQTPTQKIVLGSILCCHNGGIWGKCGQHLAVMAACCQHVGDFLSQDNSSAWPTEGLLVFFYFTLAHALQTHRLIFPVVFSIGANHFFQLTKLDSRKKKQCQNVFFIP